MACDAVGGGYLYVEIVAVDACGVIELVQAYGEALGVAHKANSLIGSLHVAYLQRSGAHAVPQCVEVCALVHHFAVHAVKNHSQVGERVLSRNHSGVAVFRTGIGKAVVHTTLVGQCHELVSARREIEMHPVGMGCQRTVGGGIEILLLCDISA